MTRFHNCPLSHAPAVRYRHVDAPPPTPPLYHVTEKLDERFLHSLRQRSATVG